MEGKDTYIKHASIPSYAPLSNRRTLLDPSSSAAQFSKDWDWGVYVCMYWVGERNYYRPGVPSNTTFPFKSNF